jgi:hypothetical protein
MLSAALFYPDIELTDRFSATGRDGPGSERTDYADLPCKEVRDN